MIHLATSLASVTLRDYIRDGPARSGRGAADGAVEIEATDVERIRRVAEGKRKDGDADEDREASGDGFAWGARTDGITRDGASGFGTSWKFGLVVYRPRAGRMRRSPSSRNGRGDGRTVREPRRLPHTLGLQKVTALMLRNDLQTRSHREA